VTTAERHYGSVELYRRLLAYAWPYKWVFLAGVGGMIAGAAADTAFTALLKPIMDSGFVERDPSLIRIIPFAIVGVFLLRATSAFVDEYCMAWVARRVVYDLRGDMFDHIIHLPARYYDHHSSASLVSKLIYDVEQVAMATTTAIRIVIKDSVLSLALLGWMSYLSWQLTLVFLAAAPLIALFVRLASKRFRRTSQRIQTSMGGIAHVAKEAFQGHRIVKAYGGHGYEVDTFGNANEFNRRQGMKKAAVAAASVPLITLVAGVAVAMVIYLALHGTGSNLVTPGTFASYLTAVMMMMSPMKRLAKVNEIIQAGVAAANSAFSTMDEPAERTGGASLPEPVRGRVEFQHVGFHYDEDRPDVLEDVSFVAEPGRTVALVGKSGSGKSTVAALLLGFYRANNGSIRLDGVPVDDLSLKALRSHIAYVGQESNLFDDTIRRNIVYGQDQPDDERLRAAADAALVSAFSRHLAADLETRIGEQGIRLSGGQRQRIAIARALYRSAPVIILDEATSALDNQSEWAVREAIRELSRERTTIVIAHRLSTIVDADDILVFDDGRVVERGMHPDLLAAGGYYSALYRSQEQQSEQADDAA
jgi:subfamily B ATP-binding cassette protein MsbA